MASATYFVISYGLTINLVMPATWSSVIGYLAGMVVSFVGQGLITFKASRLNLSQFLRFSLLSAFGLAFSFFAVFVVVDLLREPLIWALVATVLVVPAVSFVVMQLWVFYTAPER